MTARARYAFRQRVVLRPAGRARCSPGSPPRLPSPWCGGRTARSTSRWSATWSTCAARCGMEEAIRERRAARMAGTRRTPAADDRELDEWARRGREVTAPPGRRGRRPIADAEADEAERRRRWPTTSTVDDGRRRRRASAGVGEPVGLLPARRRGVADENAEPESALPRLQPPRRRRSRRGRRWSRWTRTSSTCTTSAPGPARLPACGRASERLIRSSASAGTAGSRGCGAVGSATRSHRVGQGFDSPQLHPTSHMHTPTCVRGRGVVISGSPHRLAPRVRPGVREG